jgi:hypothetical protein
VQKGLIAIIAKYFKLIFHKKSYDFKLIKP